MKKRIDIIASEEAYMNLSTFEEVEEMNKAVRKYRDRIEATVKRSDVKARLLNLLEILKRHSCVQIGVSYMCKNTIAKMLKVSYKTIQRNMAKLEELGIIKQIPTKRRSDMYQTSNAVIIVPVESAEIKEVSDKVQAENGVKCPTKKTTSFSLKQKIKRYKKRKNAPVIYNTNDSFDKADFLPHWIPNKFSSFASNFYGEAAVIKEFWLVVKQCNRVIDTSTGKRAFSKEQEIHIGIQALKEYVMKVKKGVHMKKGIFAYFNGIVNNLMNELFFDKDFMGIETYS